MLTGRMPWKMQDAVSEKTEKAFKKGKFHFPSCVPLSDGKDYANQQKLIFSQLLRVL